MNIVADLVFKKKSTDGNMWWLLKKEDSGMVSILADNAGYESCMAFDMNCLKELSLLINEYLLYGKDIKPDTNGGPKIGVDSVSLDLFEDSVALCCKDSENIEDDRVLFVIESKGGERVSLDLTVKQAKEISRALKRYVFAHELVKKAHQKKAVASSKALAPGVQS